MTRPRPAWSSNAPSEPLAGPKGVSLLNAGLLTGETPTATPSPRRHRRGGYPVTLLLACAGPLIVAVVIRGGDDHPGPRPAPCAPMP